MSLKVIGLAMASLQIFPVLAAPPVKPNPLMPAIHLTWRHDKTAATGSPSVAVDITLGNQVSLLQHPLCTTSIPTVINTGNFVKMPIVLDVDANGDGNITYGTKKYPITHLPEKSAPYCTRMYSSERAILQCDLTWGSATPPVEYHVNVDAPDCLTPATNNLFAVADFDYPAPTNGTGPVIDTGGPTCFTINSAYLEGNGNPHQNAFDIQLSENINCDSAPSCNVGHSQSRSFSVSATLSGSCPWISGGFSVTETTTTGNSYGCNAGRGQIVCIWKNVAHTAYTVNHVTGTNCSPQHQNAVIKSPNEDNRGGGYYCVVGSCRYQGASYWNDKGP